MARWLVRCPWAGDGFHSGHAPGRSAKSYGPERKPSLAHSSGGPVMLHGSGDCFRDGASDGGEVECGRLKFL